MVEIKNQLCPLCKTNNLSLKEEETTIPHFGQTLIFSMKCSNCRYSKTDVETVEKKEPCKITFKTENESDLNTKVVKSSTATIKIPQLKMSVTSGPASNGFITNIEGILDRFSKIIESEKENSEDKEARKKAKDLLKKLWKVREGSLALKIIIEDPSGNSIIISKKAEIKKLK